MITVLVLTVGSIIALLLYLTMAVATAQWTDRTINAVPWTSDERIAQMVAMGIEVVMTWVGFVVYFATTTTGSGRYPGLGVTGQGFDLGLAVTLGTIPIGLAALVACGCGTDNNTDCAQVMGILWPYALFTQVMLRLALLTFAGPAQWGTVIADIPRRQALKAMQREKELSERPVRLRAKEIEAGIEPMDGQ